MVRVRHAAVAFLPPLPRTPAARRRRHWLARATGRGQQAAVRRHRRFRRPPARRRPRPGARRHRRRVRVPRNRAIARGGPGPDAVDAGQRSATSASPTPSTPGRMSTPASPTCDVSPTSSGPCSRWPPTTPGPAPCGATTASRHTKETRAYVQAVLDRGRSVADAQAPAEQDPSRDRALAAAETDVAEGNLGDRRLQNDHLAADGAARLEPQALDLDDRARAATRPDAVGNPRGAQTGALRQDVADERPVRVGAGSAHAAADTALLVLHHGAERLRRQAWLSLVTRRRGDRESVTRSSTTNGTIPIAAREKIVIEGNYVVTSGTGPI